MRAWYGRRLAGLTAAVSAGALVAGLTGLAPAAGASSNLASHVTSPGASHCHPAQLNGSGGFLGSFTTVCRVASTVPTNGDVNPYGTVVVPTSVGNLVAGDVLVSNFNDSNNLQGTGTTIMQISPSGSATVFANLAGQTTKKVGLTTALAVFGNGDVVVGSLPTTNGMATTAKAGALYVLNSDGTLIETIDGSPINGPWDMTSYDGGSFGVLFVTNVLNGTVAGNGAIVTKGTVVRIVLDFATSPPAVLQRVVIGSGFGERTDPAALVIGPTGLALGPNGTVYVADSLANRIAAIPDGMFRKGSAGTGTTITSGGFLNVPLGLVMAPNGDLLSVNGGNGQMVETTLSGEQPEWPVVANAGGGALFGLAVQPGGTGVYFVNDATNVLDIFK